MAAAPGSPELRAAETPDTLCLSDERGRTLTWRELNALADAYAATLHDAYGVEAGGRVAVLPEPGVELFAVLLALAKLGASSVLPAGHGRHLGPGGRSRSPRARSRRRRRPAALHRRRAPARRGRLHRRADRATPARWSAGSAPSAPPRPPARSPTRSSASGSRPGHAHLLAAPPERAGPLFWAQLVLALGGRVHVAADAAPEDVLRASRSARSTPRT